MPADYNIPMTDAQITEALQLMVERVSEGWAQETYDGSPVGSGSPYYHKSSKWWATQAADAAARAEAAVPAGTAGAVFFDRAQSLTAAQQEQARQNIKAGGSNRNLLNNPWFTVNQRAVTSGQTGSNSGIYWLDRWLISSNAGYASYSISNGPVTLTPASTGTAYISQKFENHAELVGKTLTASVMFDNGTIESGTIVRADAVRQSFFTTSDGIDVFINSANMFRISVSPNYTLAIKAVKLELGSVSTLANDAPPNYAEELAKCQRYFKTIKASSGGGTFWGVCENTTRAIFPNITNAPQMRTAPTITFSGPLTVRKVGSPSTDHTVTAVGVRNNPPVISLETTTTGLTAGDPVMLMLGAGAEINLSADL